MGSWRELTFLFFGAISRISKVNNIFTCIVIAKNILCDLTDPHRARLGMLGHSQAPLGAA